MAATGQLLHGHPFSETKHSAVLAELSTLLEVQPYTMGIFTGR